MRSQSPPRCRIVRTPGDYAPLQGQVVGVALLLGYFGLSALYWWAAHDWHNKYAKGIDWGVWQRAARTMGQLAVAAMALLLCAAAPPSRTCQCTAHAHAPLNPKPRHTVEDTPRHVAEAHPAPG